MTGPIVDVTSHTNLGSAIDSAKSGSTIVFAPGEYSISTSIKLPSNITLKGTHGVYVNYTGPRTSSGLFSLSNDSNVNISGITFNGSGLSKLTNGVIEVSGAHNVHITGNTFNNVTNTSDLMMYNGNNIYFQDNTSGPNELQPVSAHLTSNSNLTGLYITDNKFLGYSRMGVEIQNNTRSHTWSNVNVDGNTFHNSADLEYGALSFVTGSAKTRNTIEGNTFYGNNTGRDSAIELGSAITEVANNTIDHVGWAFSISASKGSAIEHNTVNDTWHAVFSKDGGFTTSALPWIGANVMNGASITGADRELGNLPGVPKPSFAI